MFNSLMEQSYTIIFFWLGAIFGSFANVIIYRLPQGKSVVRPSSHCSSCKTPVKWFDNIPIVSYLILRGRCRNCGARFSIRYMIVELLMGALFAASYFYFGFSWTFLEILIFIFGLVVCTFIDFDHMILPDEFTLSGIVIGLVGAILNPERNFLDSFLGVIMGGGFLWALAYLYFLITKREGMGGGDIKLLAWIGAVLGWKAVPFVILVSSVVGSVAGIVASIKSKSGLKAVIPYGPYLVLGAMLYAFGGKTIAYWYFEFFIPGL